jgi:hypothetical protein
VSEAEFTLQLVKRLDGQFDELLVGYKRNLFYSLTFDVQGNLQAPVKGDGEPAHGGGTGLEQDILVFEKVPGGQTSIVPRVVAEVKLGGITTHDAIAYPEKVRRIRAIYPYVRYGLIIGGVKWISGRALRLGREFDFIVTTGNPVSDGEFEDLVQLLRQEAHDSKKLGQALAGTKPFTSLWRRLVTVSKN